MIEIMERAREQILGFLDEHDERLAVRVRVASPSPVAPRYELALVGMEDREPDDEVCDFGRFSVFVEPASVPLLRGVRIDWVESRNEAGFKFHAPARTIPGAEPMEGPLVQRVERAIEEQINPGVATHGGRVELAAVRDGVAYLRLHGGCQGCGMASVTLKEGVRRVLLEAVPEIREVADVTDHAGGANPYF